MSSSRLRNGVAAGPSIKAKQINQDQRRLSIWLQVVNNLGDKGSATTVLETGTGSHKNILKITARQEPLSISQDYLDKFVVV